MSKKRILYILWEYPKLSQTYIATELNALYGNYEIEIITIKEVKIRDRHCYAYMYIPQSNQEEIAQVVRDFSPDIVHGHYLFLANTLLSIARYAGVAFTVRAHSFDLLSDNRWDVSKYVAAVNDRSCLGILSLPFTRPSLEGAGIRGEKIHDCLPVVDYQRFYDPSPNGKSVMNVGACSPKKNLDDYLALATRLPEKNFDLYTVGRKRVDEIKQKNEVLGRPVNIVKPVEPRDMPREYKSHEWLVYTASHEIATVGWPVAVAEAQASGVGVCMQNLRLDLRDYVGNAGFLFDTIDDAERIISQPFSDELRQLGFEQARKSDVREHIHKLTDLWNQV